MFCKIFMLTVQFVLFSLSLFYFSVIIATLRAVFNFEFHNQLRSLYSFPILIYFTHTSHTHTNKRVHVDSRVLVSVLSRE